jgi:hypothetical protein
MHVGDDHAQDGQALELIGEHLFPLRLGLVALMQQSTTVQPARRPVRPSAATG